MATFNPKDHQGDSQGGEMLTTAGEYLLAIKGVKNDRNKNKKPFVLARIHVIYGPLKGKRFFERFYTNQESLWKLGKLCKATGHEEPFDPDITREARQAMVGKPFKAEISVRSDGKKKYAEIGKFDFSPTDEEREFMNKWVAEQLQNQDPDEDPMSGNDDWDPNQYKDDDIPF